VAGIMQQSKKTLLKAAIAVFLGIISFMPSFSLADSEIAGSISKLKGQLSLENSGGIGQMNAGNIVRMQDYLHTGDDTRADILFLDSSLMTLGDNATVQIDKMIYDPQNNDSGGIIDLIAGTFHMISGKISKTNNDFTINTPVATIGIRGTDFIVIQKGDNLSVLLLDNGTINISNAQGNATLNQAGQGIDIKGKDAPIGPIKMWGQARKDAAIAAVSW